MIEMAAAVSAQKPPMGWSLVIGSHGLDDAPPAGHRPQGDGQVTEKDQPEGDVKFKGPM